MNISSNHQAKNNVHIASYSRVFKNKLEINSVYEMISKTAFLDSKFLSL